MLQKKTSMCSYHSHSIPAADFSLLMSSTQNAPIFFGKCIKLNRVFLSDSSIRQSRYFFFISNMQLYMETSFHKYFVRNTCLDSQRNTCYISKSCQNDRGIRLQGTSWGHLVQCGNIFPISFLMDFPFLMLEWLYFSQKLSETVTSGTYTGNL